MKILTSCVIMLTAKQVNNEATFARVFLPPVKMQAYFHMRFVAMELAWRLEPRIFQGVASATPFFVCLKNDGGVKQLCLKNL